MAGEAISLGANERRKLDAEFLAEEKKLRTKWVLLVYRNEELRLTLISNLVYLQSVLASKRIRLAHSNEVHLIA